MTEPLTPEQVNDLLLPYASEVEERCVMALSRFGCEMRGVADRLDAAALAFAALIAVLPQEPSQ